MSWLSKLFGPSKNDIIRTLIKRRLAEYGVAEDFARDVNAMNTATLYGTPEATLLVIAESYAALKKNGLPDAEIFARIEKHRARAGSGQLPRPLNLRSYVTYRLALEHGHGAPVPDDFIAEALQVCRAFFQCPEEGETAEQTAEKVAAAGERFSQMMQPDAPAVTFMAAMPHPEVGTSGNHLVFSQAV